MVATIAVVVNHYYTSCLIFLYTGADTLEELLNRDVNHYDKWCCNLKNFSHSWMAATQTVPPVDNDLV